MRIDIIQEENVNNDVIMTHDTHVVLDKDIESLHFFAFVLKSLKQMWRSKNKF